MLKGLLCFLSLGITVMAVRLPAVNEKVLHKPRQMAKRSYPVENAPLWMINQDGENYIIPYVIEHFPGQGKENRQRVLDEIKDYHKYTCIKFRPRRDEQEPYVTFRFQDLGTDGTCGHSSIGMQDLQNNTAIVIVNVNCKFPYANTIVHELFHVLGFVHEFERPDSDDHMMIPNLDYTEYDVKQATGMDLTPFDHFSISHYETRIDRHTNQHIAKNIGRLSYYDIRSINERYQCNEKSEYLLRRGCAGSTLPTVIGRGYLSSNNSAYEVMEAVRVICDEGYEAVVHDISYCEDRSFSPPILECRKRTSCKDFSDKCAELVEHDVCNINSKNRELCLGTCGFCETPCWTPPLVKGPGKLNPMRGFYVENEEVFLTCKEAFTPNTAHKATCKNATWDVDEFQCVKVLRGNKDERCRMFGEDCDEVHLRQTCAPLDLDVGNGRLLPNKTFYQTGDVVQLVCDPGYEPSSSSTAHCKTHYMIGAAFDHGKLQCVQKTCEDTSDRCEKIARNNRCEYPEIIGLVRQKCRKSCNLCGSCKGMPIFDRDISSMSPMKIEYKENEIVEINCYHGYHAVETSTAECREGQFHPPQLLCQPDESSCVGPPSITDATFITSLKSIYLNGEKFSFSCKINSDDFYGPASLVSNILPRDDITRHVTCNNGRFETFYCPHETSCTLDDVNLEEICGSLDEPPAVLPPKPLYTTEEGFIQIFCDNQRMRFAKCTGINGTFFSDKVDYRHDFPLSNYTNYIDLHSMLLSAGKLSNKSQLQTFIEQMVEIVDAVENGVPVDDENSVSEGYTSVWKNCTLDEVIPEEICGFYDELPVIAPPKPIYTMEDGFIQVFCDSYRMRFAKCSGISGMFVFDGVDYPHDYSLYKYTDHINDLVTAHKLQESSVMGDVSYDEEHISSGIPENEESPTIGLYEDYPFSTDGSPIGCNGLFLPRIYGDDGYFEPMKAHYAELESVFFRCNHKSTVQVLVCSKDEFIPMNSNNTEDTPTWVACYEEDCIDLSADCDVSMCSVENQRSNCRMTCQVCEPPPCEKLAINFGGEFKHNFGSGIRHGKSDIFECKAGYKTIEVTCTRGELYPPLDMFDYCTEEEYYETSGQNCEDSYEMCPLLIDECNKEEDDFVRNRCKLTCGHEECFKSDDELYLYEGSLYYDQ